MSMKAINGRVIFCIQKCGFSHQKWRIDKGRGLAEVEDCPPRAPRESQEMESSPTPESVVRFASSFPSRIGVLSAKSDSYQSPNAVTPEVHRRRALPHALGQSSGSDVEGGNIGDKDAAGTGKSRFVAGEDELLGTDRSSCKISECTGTLAKYMRVVRDGIPVLRVYQVRL